MIFFSFLFFSNRNCKILDVIRPLNAALDQLAMIVSANFIRVRMCVCQSLLIYMTWWLMTHHTLSYAKICGMPSIWCGVFENKLNQCIECSVLCMIAHTVTTSWSCIVEKNNNSTTKSICVTSQPIPLDKSNCLVFFDFFFFFASLPLFLCILFLLLCVSICAFCFCICNGVWSTTIEYCVNRQWFVH